MQCYPNPTQGPLNVHLGLPASLSLRDMTGKLVWQEQGQEGWNRLEPQATAGTYFLEAVSVNGNRIIRRVILR
jgi:hypothetical protein